MLVLLRESINAAVCTHWLLRLVFTPHQQDPFSASCKLLIVDSLGALLSPLLATNLGRALFINISRQIKLLALQYRLAVVVRRITLSECTV